MFKTQKAAPTLTLPFYNKVCDQPGYVCAGFRVILKYTDIQALFGEHPLGSRGACFRRRCAWRRHVGGQWETTRIVLAVPRAPRPKSSVLIVQWRNVISKKVI